MAHLGRRQCFPPIIKRGLPYIPQPPIGLQVIRLQAVQTAARPRPRVRTQVLRWTPPAAVSTAPVGRLTGVMRVAIGIRPPRVRTQIIRAGGRQSVARFVGPGREPTRRAAFRPRFRTQTIRAGGRPPVGRYVPPGPETVRRSWRIPYGRVLAPHFRIVGAPFTPCSVQAVVMRLPAHAVQMQVAGDGLLLLTCDTYLLLDKTHGVRLDSTDLAGDMVCMRYTVQRVIMKCPNE